MTPARRVKYGEGIPQKNTALIMAMARKEDMYFVNKLSIAKIIEQFLSFYTEERIRTEYF